MARTPFNPHWWQMHSLYGRVSRHVVLHPLVTWHCGTIMTSPRGRVAVGRAVEVWKMAKTAKSQPSAETFAQRLLNKKKDSAESTQAGFDGELLASSPKVHELLVTVLKDDKKTLEPASLLVFARGGSFHCCLSHKALDLRWWGEGSGLRQALAALEANMAKEEGQGPSNGSGSNTATT
jgi:hypothetical protein